MVLFALRPAKYTPRKSRCASTTLRGVTAFALEPALLAIAVTRAEAAVQRDLHEQHGERDDRAAEEAGGELGPPVDVLPHRPPEDGARDHDQRSTAPAAQTSPALTVIAAGTAPVSPRSPSSLGWPGSS